ncbi:MAG: hypothetical protein GY739_06120, partial [Mesoflavibacter sp.]|nr:hypothetical protein [Mesoflavibacter sp.]
MTSRTNFSVFWPSSATKSVPKTIADKSFSDDFSSSIYFLHVYLMCGMSPMGGQHVLLETCKKVFDDEKSSDNDLSVIVLGTLLVAEEGQNTEKFVREVILDFCSKW